MLQRCRPGGHFFFYPRVLCPACGASDLNWVEASGAGVVYSTTVVRRKADQGGDYNVALVDLSEGPRMMSRVEAASPESVSIGMPVKARLLRDGVPLIVFEPLESAP